MSCGCNSNPCSSSECDAANEPLASTLNNFIVAFFGSLTKTCVNDQVVWVLPCDLDSGMPGYPRVAGEGLACYFIRVFSEISASTLIRVTDNDTNPGNLQPKLVAGNEIDITLLNSGGDEMLQIDYVITPPVLIAASDVNWALSNTFYKTLAANSTFTFSNDQEGKTIVVAITNTAGNFTLGWPAAVQWANGSQPVLTIGVKTDVFTFVKINSVIYGSVVANMS